MLAGSGPTCRRSIGKMQPPPSPTSPRDAAATPPKDPELARRTPRPLGRTGRHRPVPGLAAEPAFV